MPRDSERMFSNMKDGVSDTRFLYAKQHETLDDAIERLTKRGWGWSPDDLPKPRGRATFISLDKLKRDGKGTPSHPRIVKEDQTLSLEGDL